MVLNIFLNYRVDDFIGIELTSDLSSWEEVPLPIPPSTEEGVACVVYHALG